jgi:four helix bundle protein
MATIKRFEELDCWKEARSFVGIIYKLTKNKGFNKDFDLIRQIRRSAVSSMANTAEGFHRSSSKDFLKFLDYARSSIAETISHAYVALDQNYIDKNEMEQIKKSGNTVWKKINGLISYLKRCQQTKPIN